MYEKYLFFGQFLLGFGLYVRCNQECLLGNIALGATRWSTVFIKIQPVVHYVCSHKCTDFN